MTALNQAGVSSLRTFTIVRRELDSSGRGNIFGRLSGGESLPTHLNCLIGLHGSWHWFNEFGKSDEDSLLSLSIDTDELNKQDDILYLLPSEFQPPIAFILLDPSQIWDEAVFATGLAASSKFIGEDGRGWTQLRPIDDISELQDSETLQASGWDHEHCAVCNKHILEGDKYFFKAWGEGGSYLCVFCHDRFAKTHSIREVIYPGEGERINEKS